MSSLSIKATGGQFRSVMRLGTVAKGIGLVIFTWLFVWPLAMLIYGAFGSSPLASKQTFSMKGFVRLFTDPSTVDVLIATVVYSVVITIFSMAIAIFFATISTQVRVPFRRWITPVMVILVAMPTVLYSLSWAMLGAGEVGIINRAFAALGLSGLAESFNTRSWAGLIVVTVFKASALAYLIIVGAFRNQNAALEEAARICGASKIRAFFGIELPALMPALAAASVFIFVKGLEAFETPAVLGLPAGIEVYSTHIYSYLRGGYIVDYAAASASSLVIVAIIGLLVMLQLRITGGGRTYTSVGGRAKETVLRNAGKWTPLILLAMIAHFAVVLVLPVVQVVLSAFQSYLGASDLTLINIRELLASTRVINALKTTLIVSALGGLFTVLLSLVVSFAFVRMKGRIGRFIQVASWIPASMPGLVLGLALMWSVLLTPGGKYLYGTVWILVLGLSVATVPLATRTLEGALAQIGIDMEEAARISGASFLRAVSTVTVRLLVPSLIAAWFLVAITMSGILDVPILLAGTNTEMISIVSFGFHNNGQTVLASALYVIYTAAMAAIALACYIAWLIIRTIHARFFSAANA